MMRNKLVCGNMWIQQQQKTNKHIFIGRKLFRQNEKTGNIKSRPQHEKTFNLFEQEQICFNDKSNEKKHAEFAGIH